MYFIYKAYLNRRFPIGEHSLVHFTSDNLPLHTDTPPSDHMIVSQHTLTHIKGTKQTRMNKRTQTHTKSSPNSLTHTLIDDVKIR